MKKFKLLSCLMVITLISTLVPSFSLTAAAEENPENCTVEYVAMTDESEYQALLTDSLSFELDH